ncbi:protein WVD2-like 7 isoform X1 [Sesamum indicum]|uniref:Protein WVD2-like 7 isoform X1 n=1 Tax=Sesamum indicum TaxID=4182 RepID=A0A6I9UFZ4_SESIN|nr:protein WVD2-like 7 isoform X1 [Sesamum indicum]
MGDSACLMHGFSYASAMPNESKQGNRFHVLGESVSFGRFMTESLSWERWSTFSSHKKYVEEAQRYAQPGSVAQKKAFFEAHYKKIAAQKAAAALLEQENAAKVEAEKEAEGNVDNSGGNQQRAVLNSQLVLDEKMEEEPKIQDVMEDSEANANKNGSTAVAEIRTEESKVEITGNEVLRERSVNRRNSINQLDILENQETFSGSEGSGTPLMERPLLKNSVAIEDVSTATSKKKSGLSSLKSSIQRKTWKVPSTPSKPVTPRCKKENNVIQSTRKSSVDSIDKKRPSPQSLRELINLIPIKEHDNEQSSAAKKTDSVLAPISSRTPKACRTPILASTTKAVSNYPAATPRSENRRLKTPIDPSASGRKTTGPKWHILSAVCSKSLTACRNRLQSPTLSTPFILRTEERAAKRKQKLEEKFNANEMQKAQLQKTLKEKAGNEFRKLGCGFCFKARPLPDFYKERETSVNQMKKTPARAQPAVLGRNISTKTRGTISMPPPPPPPTSLPKNRVSKNLSNKNVLNPSKSLTSSLPERTTHENRSPNIQS